VALALASRTPGLGLGLGLDHVVLEHIPGDWTINVAGTNKSRRRFGVGTVRRRRRFCAAVISL